MSFAIVLRYVQWSQLAVEVVDVAGRLPTMNYDDEGRPSRLGFLIL